MLDLLDKMSWVQFIIIIFITSVLGSLLSEFLFKLNDGIKNAVENLEKKDGFKRIVCGISVAVLPLLCRIGFHLIGVYEPMMMWFEKVKWPQAVFLVLYVIGAIWTVMGVVMFVMALRHGND